MKLEDKNGKLAALLITHLTKSLPDFWKTFFIRMHALYGDELFSTTSDQRGYDYLAIHYHWYNRYAEKVINTSSRVQLI